MQSGSVFSQLRISTSTLLASIVLWCCRLHIVHAPDTAVLSLISVHLLLVCIGA